MKGEGKAGHEGVSDVLTGLAVTKKGGYSHIFLHVLGHISEPQAGWRTVTETCRHRLVPGLHLVPVADLVELPSDTKWDRAHQFCFAVGVPWQVAWR